MSPRGGRDHVWSGAATHKASFKNGGPKHVEVPGTKVRTLADMSAAEIAELECLYGARVANLKEGVTGKQEWWVCARCKYKVQVKDVSGKPYKPVPKTCPSCGAPSEKVK